MENLFIPYNLSLKLKELGFDEKCFTTFTPSHLGNYLANPFNRDLKELKELQMSFTLHHLPNSTWINNRDCFNDAISAPLWEQAFEWFDSKFELSSHTDLKSKNNLGNNYYYKIVNHSDIIDDSTTIIVENFETKLEAKIACLKHLIKFIS